MSQPGARRKTSKHRHQNSLGIPVFVVCFGLIAKVQVKDYVDDVIDQERLECVLNDDAGKHKCVRGEWIFEISFFWGFISIGIQIPCRTKLIFFSHFQTTKHSH